jgi:hypothetical protein
MPPLTIYRGAAGSQPSADIDPTIALWRQIEQRARRRRLRVHQPKRVEFPLPPDRLVPLRSLNGRRDNSVPPSSLFEMVMDAAAARSARV